LLRHFDSLFAQAMSQSVFVELLDVSASVITVEGETGFTDDVEKMVDILEFHGLVFLRLLAPFCG